MQYIYIVCLLLACSSLYPLYLEGDGERLHLKACSGVRHRFMPRGLVGAKRPVASVCILTVLRVRIGAILLVPCCKCIIPLTDVASMCESLTEDLMCVAELSTFRGVQPKNWVLSDRV